MAAAHSSSLSALCEGVQSNEDQAQEWRLKSPTSSMGIVELRSSERSVLLMGH
jgi:hypothetical protein